jgi:adenylosuccinate lyase
MASIENIALWHERDITHSSVERIILPDSTILLDYMQSLAIKVVKGMTVHTERMLSNLEVTHGALFSQRALLALVNAGLTRDDAYRIVQQGAQEAWDTGTNFRDLLAAEVKEQGIKIDVDAVFDPSAYTKHSREIVARLSDETDQHA